MVVLQIISEEIKKKSKEVIHVQKICYPIADVDLYFNILKKTTIIRCNTDITGKNLLCKNI